MSPSVTRSEKPVKPDEAAPPGTNSMFSAARGVMRKMGSASPKIARNRQAAASGNLRKALAPFGRCPARLRRRSPGLLATSRRLSLCGTTRADFLSSKQTTASKAVKT